jgi:hypothetical protein
MEHATEAGAAVIMVATNVGGYTGEVQQLEHVVPYILLGLERTGGAVDCGLQPHLVQFDGTRHATYRYEWDLSLNVRHAVVELL